MTEDAALSPRDLGLPKDSWRPGQWNTLMAMVASKKRIKLVEAPVGSGKSLIALAYSRLSGAQRSVILCHQVSLQEQYLESDPSLKTVRGRAHFSCNEDPSVTADAGVCTVASPFSCPSYARCDYYSQVEQGVAAPIAVLNYSYFLREANGRGQFSNLDLLICDEAHTMESQLLGLVEIDLFGPTLRRAGIELPGIPTTAHSQWRSWARRTTQSLAHTASSPLDFSRASRTDVLYMKAVKTVHERCSRLSDLDDDWIIEANPASVTFRPVWVREFGRERIFRHARDIILLSATILDATHFCQGLGLDPEEVDFFRVPSTFPKERRPIWVRPVAKASACRFQVPGAALSDDARTLVGAVDQILDAHPDVKGIVHSGNYAVGRLLLGHSRHSRRLMGHDAKSRVDTLNAFKASKGPMVLVSPSMTEGVDLAEDLCRFTITAKLPFPNKGDERVARRMKVVKDDVSGAWVTNARGNDWYMWVTACTLVQSVGRGMRSAEDQQVCYIIDRAASWFLPAVWRMLPDWFKEAVKKQSPEAVMMDLNRAGIRADLLAG